MELDHEIKIELLDSFTDLYEETESILTGLTNNDNQEDLNRLFRAVHNIKGNAGILGLTSIVDFTHSLEDVVGALRAGRFHATEDLCEVLQLGMDRLRDVHQRELFERHYENLHEEELIPLYFALAQQTQQSLDAQVNKLLSHLGAGIQIPPPQGNEEDSMTQDSSSFLVDGNDVFSIKIDEFKRQQDLLFFQELALQVDIQSRYWQGRSIQLFEWAQKLNLIAGKIVPYEQLAAAIYLHDFGMSLVPRDILEKQNPLSEEDWEQIRQHPHWAFNILSRMPGWEEAATIVLQHHERIDGTGYPEGLKGEDIHPGAKLLAIIDAFFSIINGRADRDRRRSVVRAISEINSCIDTQFDGMWVQCFNHMIRKEKHAGNL